MIDKANTQLAEFQRMSRWALWPEPDLPRTSTGKVRRKAVALWLKQHAESKGIANGREHAQRGDWLYALVTAFSAETPEGADDLRLSEDFHLDSLGRVQLAAALEERFGMRPGTSIDEIRTLGELRRVLGGAKDRANFREQRGNGNRKSENSDSPIAVADEIRSSIPAPNGESIRSAAVAYLYPHWPWWKPIAWIRSLFLELIAQPLMWFLAKPQVVREGPLKLDQPVLIVGNHVTAFDGPLIEYALPGEIRRRMAIAMSGEMLEDYRHFRNPESGPHHGRLMLFGPLAYFLVTALYNVFPLPRRRDFQRSFMHAGEALDHGMHVMVFPEGTRSAAGDLAPFRPGIGLLVKQAQTAVLPVAIRGIGALKSRGHGWFRAGTIEVHVGQPMKFGALQTETEITALLRAEVERLLGPG